MVTRGLQVDGEFAFGKTVEHSSSTAIINRDFEIIYLNLGEIRINNEG
jgi:hypothetical protein